MARTSVQEGGGQRVSPDQVLELQHGLKPLQGALKRAAQLGGALELEETKRAQLAEQQKALDELLASSNGGVTLSAETLYAARVAVRLRHGKLHRLRKKEDAEAVGRNEDIDRRIATCEALGRKLGIQLDLIDHGEDEEEEATV